uniref:BED-type domain-containing protein n=1 Tax=Panagrolaimus sp. PS1159 TaxID=55785 RepID=A0AC35GK17_9BILA
MFAINAADADPMSASPLPSVIPRSVTVIYPLPILSSVGQYPYSAEAIQRLPSAPAIHRLPSVPSASHYSSQKQIESRPMAVAQRQNTYHAPTAAALRNFKIAYNIGVGELWWNSNAFYFKDGKIVRDLYKRRCAHCNMKFNKKEHMFLPNFKES